MSVSWVLVSLALLLMMEKLVRYALVVRFFRRPLPQNSGQEPRLVSILQPIMGGDPMLAACLEENLQMKTRYPVEFWYLLDSGDNDAEKICRDLEARYPHRVSGILLLPPSPEGVSPKMFKLAIGQEAARGDIICCLDDDTTLPDAGLETCLPYLSLPGVGLAFGLPYYRSFGNLWSAYVSCFVNASSLLTYIPYTYLCRPFTINGMFFAVRRETLESVGGFTAVFPVLADDFGTAQVFRAAGWTLAQTPLRHGIRTHVRNLRHLRELMGRWFAFSRESLFRHLSLREKTIILSMGVVANLMPAALFIGTLAFARHPLVLAAGGLFFAATLGIIALLNQRYLSRTTPVWALTLLTPLVLLLFPFQMLAALFAPRPKVHWRGNVMEAQEGGTFRFITRRDI